VKETHGWLARLANEDFCYVTTTGRRTGRPHTIEIWFAVGEGRLYLLSETGERADWVRNLKRRPAVRVRLGEKTREGLAHVVEDPKEASLARELVAAKYEGWQPGMTLSDWVLAALPVGIAFPSWLRSPQ
jgi:deazaflavin-dependent oxidoreductase (nitroreductase family)